ncbi:MAG: AmpG family muropeptide MFS transporter [Sandaracinaceae bacterium]|nr:MAG: MFS transporter [Sandaracinaceae bacterium]
MSQPGKKPSFWDAFRDPRLALMIGLGFSSGLPNPLTGSTMTAWLATYQVDMATIGLFGLVHLPFNFKFVWAPVMDRFSLFWGGRRRGWMLLTQLVILVSVGVMGSFDPAAAPWMVAGLAFWTAFFSASQDIAIDAYRTDLLPKEERASGTAIFVAAYRGALIAAGAGALILSDYVPWSTVYWILAGLMGVGILTTLLSPEAEVQAKAPESLFAAVWGPIEEVVTRRDIVVYLAIIMLYKAGDVVAGHFLIPFLMDTGFSRSEVGAVFKGLGLAATIVGSLLGGGLVAKWGLRRALIVFGIAQAIANLFYCWLAYVGKDYALMTVAITVDHLLNGMGTAAFVAFLMTLCNKRFTAMQYALFSSLMTVPGRVLGGFSGFLQESVGWPGFFLTTIFLAAPAVLLLTQVEIREGDAEARGSDFVGGLLIGAVGGFPGLGLAYLAKARPRLLRGAAIAATVQLAALSLAGAALWWWA